MTGNLKTSRFLKTVMATAISGTRTVLQGKSCCEGKGEDTVNVLATSAVLAAVHLAPSVSSKGSGALQRGVGCDTVLTLLRGQNFDTRLIGNSRKHGKNNPLLGQREDNNVTVTAPGTESGLRPTYKSLTADFLSETKDGPSAAALMLQSAIAAMISAIVDLTKSNNAVDLRKNEAMRTPQTLELTRRWLRLAV